MTFKIGDRVRVHQPSHLYGYGQIGTIVDKVKGWVEYPYVVEFGDDDTCGYYEGELKLVQEVPSGASIPVYVIGKKDPAYYVEGDRPKIVADGGPQEYYDLPSNWNTFNDFIEYKSLHQWKEHSFHLGNIGKAICRWGDKDGATVEYDAKKIIYSACRVLKNIIGVENLRHYLQKLLDDPQFQSKE